MDSGKILHASHGRTCVLKLVGELRYTLGEPLNAFLEQRFRRRDFDQILIDLREAESIDSTILGLLAKVASHLRDRFGSKATLVSTNEDINQLLDSVGFYGVFNVCDRLETDSGPLQPLAAEAGTADPMAATLLEAHSVLSDLNDENRERFRDVVEALRDEQR